MSEPIVSRIQSIQARIKEIENFGKPRPAEKKAETPKNAESFSQIMKEINAAQNLDTLGEAETLPQSLMRNRTDSGVSNLAEQVIRSLKTSEAKPAERSYGNIVERAAEAYGVDAKLIHAIIKAESNYDPAAVSHRGAQGLMQLMPATARDLGVGDSFDPEQNIFGGTRYIKEMLDRYQGDLVQALAAYNAGPSAVDRAKGIPNFAETKMYVPRVLKNYYQINREE